MSGRFYRRRFYRRRRNSKLSTRKIFKNTGAKSQASQIYSLKKRVNYIARQNRPETKVYLGGSASYSFDSQTLLNTYKIFYFDGPVNGTADNNRIGNFVRSKSLSLCLTGEYYNSSETGYHNSESSGSPMRVIILQRRRADNVAAGIDTILSITGASGNDYTQQAICPLAKGITDRYYVLCDKKFIFTNDKNQLLKKITVKPYNLRYDDTTGYTNGFIFLLLSAGLHYDGNFSEFIHGTYSLKYVFTDA